MPDHRPGIPIPGAGPQSPCWHARRRCAGLLCLAHRQWAGLLYAYRLPMPEELEGQSRLPRHRQRTHPWTRDARGTFGPETVFAGPRRCRVLVQRRADSGTRGLLAKSDWTPLLTWPGARPCRPGYELALPALVQALADWCKRTTAECFRKQTTWLASCRRRSSRFFTLRVVLCGRLNPEGLRGQLQSSEAPVPTQHSTGGRAQLYERIEQEFRAPQRPARLSRSAGTGGVEHPPLRACIYHLDRALSEGTQAARPATRRAGRALRTDA